MHRGSVVMFKPGEILDFKSGMPKYQKKKLLAKYPLFNGCHFEVKCVVIRMLDGEQYLVVPCTIKTRSSARKYFDLTLNGNSRTVLVATEKFYVVDGNLFSLCKIVSSINQEDISLIYKMNEYHKQKAFEAREQKKQEKEAQKNRYLYLKHKYEMAVMNNDEGTMKTIIDELGSAPIGNGYSKVHSVPYECNNPKPYQGGKFSTK